MAIVANLSLALSAANDAAPGAPILSDSVLQNGASFSGASRLQVSITAGATYTVSLPAATVKRLLAISTHTVTFTVNTTAAISGKAILIDGAAVTALTIQNTNSTAVEVSVSCLA